MELASDVPVSITVQTVLFKNAPGAVELFLEHLDHSADGGKGRGLCSRIAVHLGDASPTPVFSGAALQELRQRFPHIDELGYEFFDENTGTSRGHNKLSRLATTDLLVLCNPDVVVDAQALWRMADAFRDETVGLVEAKQVPIEHPKAFTSGTGETSWGSGAFTMTRRSIFERLGGYDEKSFFMYCDDVDYSWRVREAGFAVVHQPAAVVFHDKRLSLNGRWEPTDAERYFSAEAALLIAHKWSRDDLVEEILALFAASKNLNEKSAAAEFLRRRETGGLVAQRDPDRAVGYFVERRYAEHRYPL